MLGKVETQAIFLARTAPQRQLRAPFLLHVKSSETCTTMQLGIRGSGTQEPHHDLLSPRIEMCLELGYCNEDEERCFMCKKSLDFFYQ